MSRMHSRLILISALAIGTCAVCLVLVMTRVVSLPVPFVRDVILFGGHGERYHFPIGSGSNSTSLSMVKKPTPPAPLVFHAVDLPTGIYTWHAPPPTLKHELIVNEWGSHFGDMSVLVFAGASRRVPAQGIAYVEYEGARFPDRMYLGSVGTGALRIVAWKQSRDKVELLMETQHGRRFWFRVPPPGAAGVWGAPGILAPTYRFPALAQ